MHNYKHKMEYRQAYSHNTECPWGRTEAYGDLQVEPVYVCLTAVLTQRVWYSGALSKWRLAVDMENYEDCEN